MIKPLAPQAFDSILESLSSDRVQHFVQKTKNNFTLELATPWCGRLCSIQTQQTVCHICWHFSVPPHKVQSPLPTVPAMDNNPLNPNIRIQILIFFPYMFSIEVVGRICWSVKKIHLPWSLPQFSWPLSFLKHWYNKENFHADHSSILGCKELLAASSHSSVTKLPCWRARDPLGQANQKAHVIVSLALQHDGFVTQEWLADEGLFHIIYCHTVYRVVAVLHFA